ncbi:MAG TPA: outer membrane beta-barrel protein, partial [Cytophagales bacterium]|nr:outer membrane beta-barrel protein [Cytophagales bacterium]
TILILSFLLSTNLVSAQAFEEGKSYVSGSYGIGSFFGIFFSSAKKAIEESGGNVSGIKVKTLGPLSLKYEYGVSEHIGLGINVNYLTNGISYDDTQTDGTYTTTEHYKLTRNTISVLARMNIHFGDHEKLDPYWGFGLGYRQATWKQEYSITSNDPTVGNNTQADPLPSFNAFPFGFETTFGMRYLFTPSVGAFAEVGFAKSFAQFGLTAKF